MMRNTCSHSLSRRRQGPSRGGTASRRMVSPAPFTWAARGQFTLSKAPKAVVWVLTARQPSITRRSKARNTPG